MHQRATKIIKDEEARCSCLVLGLLDNSATPPTQMLLPSYGKRLYLIMGWAAHHFSCAFAHVVSLQRVVFLLSSICLQRTYILQAPVPKICLLNFVSFLEIFKAHDVAPLPPPTLDSQNIV